MKEKPTGALAVVIVLAATILVLWFTVYGIYLARV
ncbi:MAG: cytochrome c oxidase subunit 2A [Truepera sp.]|nr:cytochrome c oxidase subunit 2A [Truepera sp.]MBS3966943.1 cytochrome c oxidase subunit 2A [Truepera sp.]